MSDANSRSGRTPPVRRAEVLGATRGTRLSTSRGRPAAAPQPAVPLLARLPVRYPGESGEASEVYARRSYSEPND